MNRRDERYSSKWSLPRVVAAAVTILLGYLIWASVCPENAFVNAVGGDGARTLSILLAGIIGWFYLARRTRATEVSADAAEQTADYEPLARNTARINASSSSERMGGILGLKRIADSQEEERENIIRILTAYVCERAARKGPETEPEERNRRQDFETAVEVLAQLPESCHDDDEMELSFDLDNTDLRGLHFGRSNLTFFQLQNADLAKANLRSSILVNANLKGANLSGAAVDGVKFSGANLEDADFTGAVLTGDYDLHEANVSNVDFRDERGLTKHKLGQAYYRKGCPPKNLPSDLMPPERNPDESPES